MKSMGSYKSCTMAPNMCNLSWKRISPKIVFLSSWTKRQSMLWRLHQVTIFVYLMYHNESSYLIIILINNLNKEPMQRHCSWWLPFLIKSMINFQWLIQSISGMLDPVFSTKNVFNCQQFFIWNIMLYSLTRILLSQVTEGEPRT